MQQTYLWLANFAQSIGMLYFIGIFLAVVVYAFWPGNRDRFEAAARLPLSED